MSLMKPTFWEKAKLVWYELLAALRLLSIAVAVTLSSGCRCIRHHIDGESTPYGSTVCVCRSIVEAFVEKPEWHGGCTSEATLSHIFAVPLLPVSIVCLPFEAVADTVTLPYDLLKK